MHFLSRARVVLTLIVVIVALGILPFITPPIPCLPEPGDPRSILGTLLTAQSAIAALTLAVTLFMMQGMRVRQDIDDRMYREYVRRSWVRDILWVSLMAVGITGVLLLGERFISGNGATANVKPELTNLVLASGTAFVLNVVLAVVLFETALLHSRPEWWIVLRRDVTKTDVREAVGAFVRRARRASDASTADEPDFSVLFPDRDEGSADEAVRALLDDARRAMSERRHDELRRSLDAVLELVKYAIDEIKRTDIQWGTPGTQPEWPPLRELSRNLYSFREDVIRQGDREYIFELLRLDYRLTIEGMRERCGELFTVGLHGYRWNYQIANRIGEREFREMLRDRFSLNANAIMNGIEPVEAFPYASELVKDQERLLSDAMHSGQPGDYDQLHSGFLDCLRAIRLDWRIEDWPSSKALELYQELEQEYRIALMGLGGRALLLAQADRVADVTPFLNVTRGAFGDLGQIADDLVLALSHDDTKNFSLWQEWETEHARPLQSISISSERYPLMWFTLRLMELSSDTMPRVDLHGKSQQVLNWFTKHVESIGCYVHADLSLTLQRRRERATEALRSAVRRDEVAEDCDIISRELSAARVSALKSDVYAAACSSNSVERLFDRSDVRLYLPGDAADAPRERAIQQFEHKGFLTDTPDGSLIDYAPLNGGQWGSALSNDVLQRFCETLEGSPEVVVSLETPAELLQGINRAIDDLTAPQQVIVVLAGNWSDLQVGLSIEDPDGYEASWKLPKSDRMGEIGRYRSYPILSTPDYKDRCVYVVDLAGWGHFVRAPAAGHEDLRVEIKPISMDRAHELLRANADLISSEPDEDSKLRKLQTFVEVVIGARTGFRVTDPARARRLVPIHRPVVNSEASQC